MILDLHQREGGVCDPVGVSVCPWPSGYQYPGFKRIKPPWLKPPTHVLHLRLRRKVQAFKSTVVSALEAVFFWPGLGLVNASCLVCGRSLQVSATNQATLFKDLSGRDSGSTSCLNDGAFSSMLGVWY